MNDLCCNLLDFERRDVSSPFVTSPFVRLVATGYYDGALQGIVECGVCSTLHSFQHIDWDDWQDIRIFTLAKIAGRSMSEIEALATNQRPPRWPQWILMGDAESSAGDLVEEMRRSAPRPDVVMAAMDPLGQLSAWRRTSAIDGVDWFVEFGLDRAGDVAFNREPD